jgi:hypothetical protein
VRFLGNSGSKASRENDGFHGCEGGLHFKGDVRAPSCIG